ncbi:MAG: SRPBCC family protein [Acidimicrobiia bacterium]|nr:SRPBCC family protein [Acidimicrobiia bacterium]
MRSVVLCIIAALVVGPPGLHAQAPASPALSPIVEKPTFTSVQVETTVNRPVADVWARIGKFCAVAEWFPIPSGCTIIAGTEDEVGAVRSVATEIMVAKTQYSYTYAQHLRPGRPYDYYHGTLEARPVDGKSTRLIYTLVFDNSTMADDAAREKDKATRAAMFTRALGNMKTLAEGGTLTPPGR